jgi:hypothetical protein
MNIEIGRAPDYVMRRGQEALNHRMKLVIQSRGQKVFDEVFTSRSLAMVLRQGQSVLERQNFFQENSRNLLKIDSSPQRGQLILKTFDREAKLILYLPADLTIEQADQLNHIFAKFFHKIKS